MPTTQGNTHSPRTEALRLMSESLPSGEQEKNWQFVNDLKKIIADHPLNNAPIIETLNSGDLSFDQLKTIHLEYREAIVRIFTDALTAAVFNTRQLEPRLKPGSKMAARSLLTLNCLDEFGFRPGTGQDGYYIGTPEHAHYPLFEKVLKQLNLDDERIQAFKPSASSIEVKDFLENAYHSYPLLLALLAVAEAQVITFSPALRAATHYFEFDVSSGYYHVHGVSTDAECEAADDDHEDDLWAALVQAITPEQYDMVKGSSVAYLELWATFWSDRMKAIESEAKAEMA